MWNSLDQQQQQSGWWQPPPVNSYDNFHYQAQAPDPSQSWAAAAALWVQQKQYREQYGTQQPPQPPADPPLELPAPPAPAPLPPPLTNEVGFFGEGSEENQPVLHTQFQRGANNIGNVNHFNFGQESRSQVFEYQHGQSGNDSQAVFDYNHGFQQPKAGKWKSAWGNENSLPKQWGSDNQSNDFQNVNANNSWNADNTNVAENNHFAGPPVSQRDFWVESSADKSIQSENNLQSQRDSSDNSRRYKKQQASQQPSGFHSYPDDKSETNFASPHHPPVIPFPEVNLEPEVVKKKALPLWLRDSLEKLEKEKKKKEEKTKEKEARLLPSAKEISGYQHGDEELSADESPKDSPKRKGRDRADSDSEDDLQRSRPAASPKGSPIGRKRSDSEEKDSEPEEVDEQERQRQTMLKIKRWMTETLLGVTNQELCKLCEEVCFEIKRSAKTKAQQLRTSGGLEALRSSLGNQEDEQDVSSANESDSDGEQGSVSSSKNMRHETEFDARQKEKASKEAEKREKVLTNKRNSDIRGFKEPLRPTSRSALSKDSNLKSTSEISANPTSQTQTLEKVNSESVVDNKEKRKEKLKEWKSRLEKELAQKKQKDAVNLKQVLLEKKAMLKSAEDRRAMKEKIKALVTKKIVKKAKKKRNQSESSEDSDDQEDRNREQRSGSSSRSGSESSRAERNDSSYSRSEPESDVSESDSEDERRRRKKVKKMKNKRSRSASSSPVRKKKRQSRSISPSPPPKKKKKKVRRSTSESGTDSDRTVRREKIRQRKLKKKQRKREETSPPELSPESEGESSDEDRRQVSKNRGKKQSRQSSRSCSRSPKVIKRKKR